MKRIYVIEDLCNGCRLCQVFCASLDEGVFSEHGRIKVIKVPGEERDIPLVDCSGQCVRTVFSDDLPTCVSVCPTGALLYADQEAAEAARLEWEAARNRQSVFKVIAPWKWPWRYQKTAVANLQERGAGGS